MKKRLLALALLGAARTASATDWELSARAEGVNVFIAADRITRNGDYVEIWQKMVYAKPQRINNQRYDYTIDQITVYCNAAGYALRVHSATYYTRSGESVASISQAGTWDNVIPDSVAEDVVARACKQ